MGTCWATDSWATDSWVAGSWADGGASKIRRLLIMGRKKRLWFYE